MSLVRLLLEVLEEATKAPVEQDGVAGRDMKDPPGTGSPWSMPPITGGSIRRPPGSDSPWSWP
jgi:hypothetical protein